MLDLFLCFTTGFISMSVPPFKCVSLSNSCFPHSAPLRGLGSAGIFFLPGLSVFPTELAYLNHVFTFIDDCIESTIGKCMCSDGGVIGYSVYLENNFFPQNYS